MTVIWTDIRRNAFMLCHHVCHFIISFPLAYKRRHWKTLTKKEKMMGRLYIRECQWPIDIEYMHIVHIRTNEISLSYGHIRLTKKRKKKREKESTMLFVYQRMLIEDREKERKKNICWIYVPLYLYFLYCYWY
jgi:hypothetical protein